jgi:transcriptional regulator with XRE-family HTH domain
MKPPVKVDPTFGLAVRHARIERDMTQEELSFAAGLAVASVGHIERGESTASLISAEAIARALGLSVKELLPARPIPPRRARPTPAGVDKAVGATVRRLRKQRELSRQQLAEEARLTLETVGRIERGECSPRMNTMQAIADGLELGLHDVIEAIEQARAGAAAP